MKIKTTPPDMAGGGQDDSSDFEGQKNLEGFTQVTAEGPFWAPSSELGTLSGPQLAGVTPHAPVLQKAKKHLTERPSVKTENFKTKLTPDLYARALARATALDLTPAAYLRLLICKDLEQPPDPADEAAKSRSNAEALRGLLGSWNKIGGLFNQIAAHLNKGRACPYSRPELNELKAQHSQMVERTLRQFGLD